VNSSQDEAAAQARVATQLRELRLAAGLGGIEAGRRARISQSKISKLERQELRPAPADVRTLCEVYGTAPDLTEELVLLSESLRDRVIEPPRVILSRGAHHFQQRVRRLEESAILLRSYQPAMVIGLVQTRAYARLIFAGGGVPGPEIDEAVDARMERQAVLRDRVPRAILIMSEGALRWQMGSPDVMAEQVDAIAVATEMPNVEIGIIPYTTPAAICPRHGFHLYDSDAAIIGTETGTATVTDPDDIAAYERMFGQLYDLAAMGAAARDVLARIAADYRRL
jgi:transcriptional regulator with XRE-family HTH domain